MINSFLVRTFVRILEKINDEIKRGFGDVSLVKVRSFHFEAASMKMLFLNPSEPAQDAQAQLDPFQSRATHFPSFFSRT